MIGYSEDYYGWTLEQADLLLTAQFNKLDIPNLVREIVSMGRNEKREAENRLAMLLAHLLIRERHIERRQAKRRSSFKRENQLDRRSKPG
jgi:DNA-directed RNA polymerase delta subunit